MRARCGGGAGAAAWVLGALAAPGTQGSWCVWQQEYSALEGYDNQYRPIHSSILTWRTPLTEKPTVHRVKRVGHNQSNPMFIDARLKSCIYEHGIALVVSNSFDPVDCGLLCQGGSPSENTGVYWPVLVVIPF